LYKVKKGKQERYVKDDAELNAYLLQLALEGAKLHVNSDAPAISDTGLETLAHEYMRVNLQFDRMERKYSREIIEEFINVDPLKEEDLTNESVVEAYAKRLTEVMNDKLDPARQYRSEVYGEDDGLYGIKLLCRIHGNDNEYLLEPGLFQSPDYKSIAALAEKLNGMLDTGAFVQRGERKNNASDFKSVMDWLIKESKRGLTIQRYKGLGEMNPEQLWETTMNPEARRMLQVSIEDAMTANEVFDTLMGDQVEPRRDFIERNALAVSNLDV
jgi:DNA gyrase subunit B